MGYLCVATLIVSISVSQIATLPVLLWCGQSAKTILSQTPLLKSSLLQEWSSLSLPMAWTSMRVPMDFLVSVFYHLLQPIVSMFFIVHRSVLEYSNSSFCIWRQLSGRRWTRELLCNHCHTPCFWKPKSIYWTVVRHHLEIWERSLLLCGKPTGRTYLRSRRPKQFGYWGHREIIELVVHLRPIISLVNLIATDALSSH